ncbi:MAG: NADH:flavin oxidoreductase [Bryobacteraceae bacterium]|jgi:2,4-dienoyl-CoA reductase-like NADH-dependent reductase (Old Yellow Enzyme family)
MRHFVYKTLDELQRAAELAGTAHVRFSGDPAQVRQVLARPVRVGAFTVGNSIAIQPMEGCDGTLDGGPGELTWRRYERFARGGAKLIWFEATAVREDGRANTRQLWIARRNVAEFARLLARIREVHREHWGSADDLLAPIQLTHSGRYSVPRRIIAYHNPHIDRKTGTPPDYPAITDDELERLEDDYVSAAGLALEAGFQAVDIKAVHGYLISELLGSKTRAGRYGGALENRLRFMRNIIGKLRAAFGNRLTIAVRMNAFDGVPFGCAFETPYPYGWGVDAADPLHEDLGEVKQAIACFREWSVALLNISLGSPYYNPHIGRPFEKPDEGNYEQPEHPLAGVDRHFRIAGELQRAFPDLPIVGTGYSWLQKYAINAGAHNIAAGDIRFLGIGRGALAYPDFARDALEKGELDERRCCKTLTYCTYLMRKKNHPLGQFPTGCPPFDKEGYGEIIKLARHS